LRVGQIAVTLNRLLRLEFDEPFAWLKDRDFVADFRNFVWQHHTTGDEVAGHVIRAFAGLTHYDLLDRLAIHEVVAQERRPVAGDLCHLTS
jgi:hypothetical protein